MCAHIKKGTKTKPNMASKCKKIDRSNVPALLKDLEQRFPGNSFAEARADIETWFGIDVLKSNASENRYKPALEEFKSLNASPYLIACVPVVRRILTNCRNAANVNARRKERALHAEKSAVTFKQKYQFTQKKLKAALALARSYGAPEKDIVRIKVGKLPPTCVE